MSLLERLLLLIVAILMVAALVGLLKFDIGRNAAVPATVAPAHGIIQPANPR